LTLRATQTLMPRLRLLEGSTLTLPHTMAVPQRLPQAT
jgi:hypothetical protein